MSSNAIRPGEYVPDEQESVIDWRREQLAEMRDQHGHGFSLRQVRILAMSDCDLHEARAILCAGCTIPVAFEILSPLML